MYIYLKFIKIMSNYGYYFITFFHLVICWDLFYQVITYDSNYFIGYVVFLL